MFLFFSGWQYPAFVFLFFQVGSTLNTTVQPVTSPLLVITTLSHFIMLSGSPTRMWYQLFENGCQQHAALGIIVCRSREAGRIRKDHVGRAEPDCRVLQHSGPTKQRKADQSGGGRERCMASPSQQSPAQCTRLSVKVLTHLNSLTPARGRARIGRV